MDREDLLAALMDRDDPASGQAVAAIRRGVNIHEGWGTSAPITVANHFSANDNDRGDELEVVGHENSMSALRDCTLPAVETISIEDMPNERWFIHLDPESHEVVACHGIILAPNPPTPVHNREDVPDTLAEVVAAFARHRLTDGQSRPYDVRVTRELDTSETARLHASWPRRRAGFYSQARQIKLLGGAEVSGHDPNGAPFSGYLLILDIGADPQLQRHRYGRVDALLLVPRSRGGVQLVCGMPFQYRAGPED